MSGAPATPRLAASLILLTRAPDGALLTLLLKRTSKASFMPSALVFPGGGLEGEDLSRARGLHAQGERCPSWAAWGFEGEAEALAQRLCALRECDEEAGAALTPALKGLSLPCVGRWLTPDRLPKRFDTSFWLGALSEAQEVSPDRAEVTEGAWRSPEEVLSSYSQGDLELAPPTIRILADLAALARSPKLDALWSRAPDERLAELGARLAGAPHHTPICPNLVKRAEDNELWLCFPSDEAYHDPTRRYEPNPSPPYNRLWRPLDQAKAPWRLRFHSRST